MPAGRGDAPNPYQMLSVQGLPLIKPPYCDHLGDQPGSSGEIMWQVAHGETPDNIRKWPQTIKGVEHSDDRPDPATTSGRW